MTRPERELVRRRRDSIVRARLRSYARAEKIEADLDRAIERIPRCCLCGMIVERAGQACADHLEEARALAHEPDPWTEAS